MGSKLRMVIMLLTALAAAGSILWMQGRYEAADQKNALEIVQSYHSPAGTSIPELLAQQHPNQPISWTTTVESSCYQHIRVQASVGNPPRAYAFIVDINGPAIHPANEPGKQLLTDLDKPIVAPLPVTKSGSP